MENRTERTIDILLATVVFATPAFLDESPIMKNIPINKIPTIIEKGNQGSDGFRNEVSNFNENANPSREAVR